MADIYTGGDDEETIRLVLEKGLAVRNVPKWSVLRLALAHSLHIATPPSESLDRIEDRKNGSEYHLEQVTGRGLGSGADHEPTQDYDAATRALLSVYHDTDLLADTNAYKRLLQRHIRRGLREFRTGWRVGHDFHDFLYQELFSQHQGSLAQELTLTEELERGLTEIGVRGDIQKTLRGPRLTRFQLHLPDVNDLDRLKRGLEKLSFSLGLQEQGIFTAPTRESKVIGLDVPRPRDTWETIPGSRLVEWIASHGPEGGLPVWPGVDVLGEPVMLDLARAPHLLVGGTTGSGKSVCLHALLVSLLRGPSRDRLQLCLIDPKRVEFEAYKGLRGLYGEEVFSDSESALSTLQALVDEMDERIVRLAELGARDIAEAHAKGAKNLPYIAVFVEELADLLMQSRASEEPLVRLAQKARATGIHLVLATQRPDAATFSGLLRSNIPARIALTVQKASESKIILDRTGAERLTGMGDMLVATGQAEPVRVHGVRVMADDIAAAVTVFNGGAQ